MDTHPAIEVATARRDALGEGPVWDDRRARLLTVDITAGLVHALDPRTGEEETTDVGGLVGSVLLTRSGDGLVVAVDQELRRIRESGRHEVLACVDEPDDNRFNDCRPDPAGRIWAGTLNMQRRLGTAALYRLEHGGAIEQVRDGLTISNGIGWSPDGRLMYSIDSLAYRIDVADYDVATGGASDLRPFATLQADGGLPDGLAVDAEGGVWLCVFGGAELRRYDPDGTLTARLPLPVTNPTCPTFGGDDLETLYVTSARHKLTPEQLAAEPLAGAVLALDPGVRGLPAARCAW